MAADVGGKPEAVKADGDHFQPRTAQHQMEKFAARAGKGHRQRRRMLRHQTDLIHRSTLDCKCATMKHREHGFMNIGLSAEMKSGSNGFYADFSNIPHSPPLQKPRQPSLLPP